MRSNDCILFFKQNLVFFYKMELTDKEIRENREHIKDLLKSTQREGVDNLLNFLDRSGYFYLYGSFRHHEYKGGLAMHSLQVMNYALEHNKSCDRNSIIITALLHDICKTKYNFPHGIKFEGHGTKSVSILKFIGFPLTEDEELAIRFHMGSKCFIRNKEEQKRFEKAQESELWQLIHVGDCISAGNYIKPAHGVVKKVIKWFEL